MDNKTTTVTEEKTYSNGEWTHFIAERTHAVYGDKRVRYMVVFYIVWVLLAFMLHTYGDAKVALLSARSRNVEPDKEFQLLYDVCYDKSFSRFITAVYAPFTSIASVVPYVVLALNPRR